MASSSYYTVGGRILGQRDSAGVRTDYVRDHLGSVIATTNQSGNVLNKYRYQPYGAVAEKTGTAPDPRFLWVGIYGSRATRVPSVSNYNRHRHYGAKYAGWTTNDQLCRGEMPYGYCDGDPINYIDYDGFQRTVIQRSSSYSRGLTYRQQSGNGVVPRSVPPRIFFRDKGMLYVGGPTRDAGGGLIEPRPKPIPIGPPTPGAYGNAGGSWRNYADDPEYTDVPMPDYLRDEYSEPDCYIDSVTNSESSFRWRPKNICDDILKSKKRNCGGSGKGGNEIKKCGLPGEIPPTKEICERWKNVIPSHRRCCNARTDQVLWRCLPGSEVLTHIDEAGKACAVYRDCESLYLEHCLGRFWK